jgi:hypothetical protein
MAKKSGVLVELISKFGGVQKQFPSPGYYSDGTTVYEWDGVSSFGFYGPCGRGRP